MSLWLPWQHAEHLWVLVPDIVLVLVSEVLVDWVKHAFITKFNEIPSEVGWPAVATHVCLSVNDGGI